MKRRQILCAIVAAAALCSLPAASQVPMRILSGFPPGGGVDALARLYAEKFSEALGRPVVVDTRIGAAGQISAQALKASAPDGNTLMVAPDSMMTLYPHTVSKRAYDTLADFIPVAYLGGYASALAVGPAVPARDLNEYLAWAKGSSKNTSYGTAGAGTAQHFLGLIIGQASGLTMVHVPYKGVGPALNDAIGGQIPAVILPLGTILPQAAAAKLRILAHSGSRRSPSAPDIPTFRELGYPSVEATGWFGLFAPAGTPAEIVNRYNAIVIQAVRTQATRERLRTLDLETREISPAEIAATLKVEYERWGPVVRTSGFRADQ